MNKISAIILPLIIFTGCGGGGGGTPAPHTPAATWQSTQWNNGVTLKQSAGQECSFVFPNSGHVNLIARSWINPIRMGATITITYKISPLATKPWFKSLDPSPAPPGLQPNFRPMLYDGDMSGDNGRFWPAGAQCAFLIADGQVHTYKIKIDPKLWTNVWGQYNAAGFSALCSHPYQIHLAFGGGNSFSHGIRGNAVFVLFSFKVQ